MNPYNESLNSQESAGSRILLAPNHITALNVNPQNWWKCNSDSYYRPVSDEQDKVSGHYLKHQGQQFQEGQPNPGRVLRRVTWRGRMSAM